MLQICPYGVTDGANSAVHVKHRQRGFGSTLDQPILCCIITTVTLVSGLVSC